MTRIKACGLQSSVDASRLLDVWAWGVILHHYSPRSLSLAKAKQISKVRPDNIELCGVFQDQPLDKVLDRADKIGLTMLQFQGQESSHYCRQAQKLSGLPVIKSKIIESSHDVEQLLYFDSDFYMISTSKGKFNQELIKQLPPEKIILSGGLDHENVGPLIKEINPWAVNACRALETTTGQKNSHRIRSFIEAVD